MNTPFVQSGDNWGSSKREQARGRRRWHSSVRQVRGRGSWHFSVRQVAGSPLGGGQCVFVPNVQTGCVLDPSSLGELSLIAETEAIFAYKVIMKAFGGVSVSTGLWASFGKGHIHGCSG